MSHQNQLKAARNPGRIDIKGRVAISVRRLTVYGTLQKNAFFDSPEWKSSRASMTVRVEKELRAVYGNPNFIFK